MLAVDANSATPSFHIQKRIDFYNIKKGAIFSYEIMYNRKKVFQVFFKESDYIIKHSVFLGTCLDVCPIDHNNYSHETRVFADKNCRMCFFSLRFL
jgi:hypothetical protein